MTVCGPEALNTVVTDAPVDARTSAALNEAGVAIIEATAALAN